jgi:hypothetical protein
MSQKSLQIGNAIPPTLAKCLANQIKKCDLGQTNSLPAGLISDNVTKSSVMSPSLKFACGLLDELLPHPYTLRKLF